MTQDEQDKFNNMNNVMLDTLAFNEGLTEHIGDMLEAMKPFVEIIKETSGRIPVERLSFADWHGLAKVFDAAKAAVCVNESAIAASDEFRQQVELEANQTRKA